MTDKYRYYCITEATNIYQDITIGNPAPTTCVNSSSHSIDLASVTIIKRNQLMNKYIDSSNYVVATALANNSGAVDIDLSTTPTTGQLIVANSSNYATWGSIPRDYQITNSTVNVTNSSTTYVDMSNMSLTTTNPGTMTYLIIFNGVIKMNAGSARNIEIIININGNDIAGTHITQYVTSTATYTVVSTTYLVDIPNSQIVKVRWKTSGGTAIIYERSLIIAGI